MSREIVGERREVLYRGTVQGVGFRYTGWRIAGRFTITGYIRNLPNGRVQLTAEGEPAELDRFLAALYQEMGPHIEQVEQVVLPATGEFRYFEILH